MAFWLTVSNIGAFGVVARTASGPLPTREAAEFLAALLRTDRTEVEVVEVRD
jgi:hypothetical protein